MDTVSNKINEDKLLEFVRQFYDNGRSIKDRIVEIIDLRLPMENKVNIIKKCLGWQVNYNGDGYNEWFEKKENEKHDLVLYCDYKRGLFGIVEYRELLSVAYDVV